MCEGGGGVGVESTCTGVRKLAHIELELLPTDENNVYCQTNISAYINCVSGCK